MAHAGNYSFLIAFARQLNAALTRAHGNVLVTDAVESLADSMDLLLDRAGAVDGEGPDGDDDGIEDGDDDGFGPPLGGPEPLDDSRASDVVITKRRAGPTPSDVVGDGVDVARSGRSTPVLRTGRTSRATGRRRGKK